MNTLKNILNKNNIIYLENDVIEKFSITSFFYYKIIKKKEDCFINLLFREIIIYIH